jgi:hypothetical protein
MLMSFSHRSTARVFDYDFNFLIFVAVRNSVERPVSDRVENEISFGSKRRKSE